MPWQPLVDVDLKILSKIESTVGGISEMDILQNCEFIMNVIIQDFPAEVMLQRPAIVYVSFDGVLNMSLSNPYRVHWYS